MKLELNKIENYKVPFLLFLNTFFFWFVIQTIRGFALTTSYESTFSLIGFALVIIIIEIFLQSIYKNLVMAKIGFMLFSIILIIINLMVLNLTEFENYYVIILIGYGIFFPGFYDYISKVMKDSNNKGAILIVFSFICSFIANLIERYLLLTFNPILNTFFIYVITPILCILFIVIIYENKRDTDKKQELSSIKNRIKMRLNSNIKSFSFKNILKMRLINIVCTVIITCIFIIQMVLYNNPSLIGIISDFDYELTVFFIILSYAIFVIIFLFFSLHFKIKDKRFQHVILFINSIVLLTFLLALIFQSPVQMILVIVSNVLLLFYLIIILAFQETHNIQSYFLTCILLTMIVYLINSAFGVFRIVLPIVCVVMFIFSIILLFTLKQDFSISYNIKKEKKDNQIKKNL